ncbi:MULTISPECIES: hypothetical protein [Halanaerobiaceae]|uniref:hypothetical protein n=1 Tax=Halanaerobiaceae TaxID=972 RepID=UPI001E31BED0|nr:MULTISPECIES: hypothetical protein [Halanaerobiaceae]
MDIENIKGSLLIAILTFLIAILVTLGSQLQIEHVSLIPAIIILLIIIFIGIISDMIGVAATAANIKTFNARAAKRLFGAKEALFLVKHADRVASLMCDIVGDICGTVSGATGAIIVLRIIAVWGGSEGFINLIVIGLVAALTVGGKSFFKTYGIKSADEIIFFVGKIIAGFILIRLVIAAKLRGDK